MQRTIQPLALAIAAWGICGTTASQAQPFEPLSLSSEGLLLVDLSPQGMQRVDDRAQSRTILLLRQQPHVDRNPRTARLMAVEAWEEWDCRRGTGRTSSLKVLELSQAFPNGRVVEDSSPDREWREPEAASAHEQLRDRVCRGTPGPQNSGDLELFFLALALLEGFER